MGLHSSISNLFSLSMLIRRDRPKGRRLDSRRFVSLDKTADITYVEDRFPKLRQTPWLAQRLGKLSHIGGNTFVTDKLIGKGYSQRPNFPRQMMTHKLLPPPSKK
uniref:Uncharacterized protein n=1 Tax=Bionectria ochroleuca TaxID=29856 RepID=A0A8H7NLZ9_BIOOC